MHKNKFTTILDFFLPRICTVCDIKLGIKEKVICSNCYAKIEKASDKLIRTEFERKFSEDNFITDFTSCYIFQNSSEIQEVIHSLKYDQKYQIGEYFGEDIAKIEKRKIDNWNADLIIPIPLHKLKKAERGFNQAEKIAKGMSKVLGIKVKENIIRRVKFTKTQTKLTLPERKKNMSKAFKIGKTNTIKNKKIILVDDVITTGATISECAKLLLNSGADQVFAISIAIAE